MANLSNIRASMSFHLDSNGKRATIRVWHTFAIQVVAESDIPLQPDGSIHPRDARVARVAALEMLSDKLASMADDALEAWGASTGGQIASAVRFAESTKAFHRQANAARDKATDDEHRKLQAIPVVKLETTPIDVCDHGECPIGKCCVTGHGY